MSARTRRSACGPDHARVDHNAGLPFQRRDDIERAALEIRGIGDTAYYYAGLAFGLAFAYGYRN
jgi:hypothetical protein